MNWEAIAAVAEALGSAAVVASLVYLASQIRQSNRQAQGQAHAAWLTTWNETIKDWVRDRETVEILQRGFGDLNSLSNVETAIFAQQLAALINHWHLAADLWDRGLLDEALYVGATNVVLSVCATGGASEYLMAHAHAFPRGPQLRQMVTEGRGGLPPFNVVAPWWRPEADDEIPERSRSDAR